MPKKLLVIFFLIIGYRQISAQNDSDRVITPHVSPVLKFTENRGQWDNKVLFRAQLDGGALFLEENGLTFNFYDKKKYRALHEGAFLKGGYKDPDLRGHAYKIIFEGSNPGAAIERLQAGSGYENFFIGNDKSRWASEVKSYHQVWLRNVYNGIDYEVITAASGLKYNFHVKANADPGKILLRYEGVDKIKLKDGALLLKLEVNDIIEQKPYAYQVINGKIKKVACHYIFKNNVLAFGFPNGYNKNEELIIDPVLVFAAQSGSTADNFGMTATYDPQGNLYSGGTAFNLGYPTTTGAYSIVFNGPPAQGNTDVVITKYNASGTALLFSTYIGGSGTEIVTSLIVDKNNNLCFYGATGSSNFPITAGAFDASFNGGQFLSFYYNGTTFNNGTDIYVGKFNSSGTSLLASTFLGGSGNDGVNHVNHLSGLNTPSGVVQEYVIDSLQYNYGDQYRGEIQLDASNNIYIASSTRSADFPMVNGFDNSLGGKQDGILAKFNPNLTALLYSSFVGGSSNDAGYGLLVRNNLEVYMTGGTCSQDFPFTTGGYQSNYQGGKADGYIIRVNPAGNNVLNATFFGTPDYDQSYFIQTDKYEDIYIYGQSVGNMPVLAAPNATAVFNVPNTHQFISRLNKDLNTLNMSTVFGNYPDKIDISPAAFSVDKCNNIYVCGWGGNFLISNSTLGNMPMASPTQNTTNGFDFYFMGLDSNAVTLQYGSYFGGAQSQEHVDGGTSRFDPLGKIYQSVCAGCGGHDDFPVTPGAWPGTPGNPNHSLNCNNGVLKLDFQLQLTIATINSNTLAGCTPFTVTFTNSTSMGPNSNYVWYLDNGVTTSSNPNPSVTYTNPGTYTVSLVVTNSTTCNKKDSAIIFITAYPNPTVNFSFTVSPCTNTIITSNSSVGNFGSNPYTWNFGNSVTSTLVAPSYTYPANGNFTVSLTATDVNGCSDDLSKPLTIFNFTPGVVSSASVCSGESARLQATGGTSYTWSPPSTLNNNSIPNPVASPTVTTVYTVDIVNNTPGYTCAKTLTAELLVYPTATANFNFSVNPCGGGVYFNDLSENNIVTWDWSLGPGLTSTVQAPYHFYFSGGSYSVQLIATNEFGCKDTLRKPLSVPVPPPLAISRDTIVCKGGRVALSASGGTAYSWTPPATLDFPMINNPNASPLNPTEYSVVITTTNSINGVPCRFLLTTRVNISYPSSLPVGAQANPRIVVTGNQSILTYVGDPGAIVSWYPAGSTIPSTGYTVAAKPDKPTTYTAVANYGVCREVAEVLVEAYTEGCLEKDVFVPNTFTPNNDNQNDIFMVRGIKVNEMHFAVYNRWGELVFETTDKTRGWDGTYKGRQADIGVFGWYLKVKCFNGEETFRKGNVTLIR